MTFREIRNHKFKILFSYYITQNDIDIVLQDYFNNFPYEEDDENVYIKKNVSYNNEIRKVIVDDINGEKNDIEFSITEEENIREIKQKVKDIVSKTDEIDSIIITNLKNWELSRIGQAEITIIRLAIYEMYFDSSIDLQVAINEAVELAKIYADDKANKFINGILATIYKQYQKK